MRIDYNTLDIDLVLLDFSSQDCFHEVRVPIVCLFFRSMQLHVKSVGLCSY